MTPFLRNTEEATGYLESLLPSFGLVSGHIGSANRTYTSNPHNNAALGIRPVNISLETAFQFLSLQTTIPTSLKHTFIYVNGVSFYTACMVVP